MPKKTRKEKILAQKRQNNAFVFSYTAQTTRKTVSPVLTQEYNYIKKDIVKTVFLGGIFILGEVFLYLYSKQLGW